MNAGRLCQGERRYPRAEQAPYTCRFVGSSLCAVGAGVGRWWEGELAPPWEAVGHVSASSAVDPTPPQGGASSPSPHPPHSRPYWVRVGYAVSATPGRSKLPLPASAQPPPLLAPMRPPHLYRAAAKWAAEGRSHRVQGGGAAHHFPWY